MPGLTATATLVSWSFLPCPSTASGILIISAAGWELTVACCVLWSCCCCCCCTVSGCTTSWSCCSAHGRSCRLPAPRVWHQTQSTWKWCFWRTLICLGSGKATGSISSGGRSWDLNHGGLVVFYQFMSCVLCAYAFCRHCSSLVFFLSLFLSLFLCLFLIFLVYDLFFLC